MFKDAFCIRRKLQKVLDTSCGLDNSCGFVLQEFYISVSSLTQQGSAKFWDVYSRPRTCDCLLIERGILSWCYNYLDAH